MEGKDVPHNPIRLSTAPCDRIILPESQQCPVENPDNTTAGFYKPDGTRAAAAGLERQFLDSPPRASDSVGLECAPSIRIFQEFPDAADAACLRTAKALQHDFFLLPCPSLILSKQETKVLK